MNSYINVQIDKFIQCESFAYKVNNQALLTFGWMDVHPHQALGKIECVSDAGAIPEKR